MKRPDKNPWRIFRVGNLPKTYAPCLLYCRHKDFSQFDFIIVYGYLKFAAGDKNCPYFVTPGATNTEGAPILWMHCSDATQNFEPQVLWAFAKDLLAEEQ